MGGWPQRKKTPAQGWRSNYLSYEGYGAGTATRLEGTICGWYEKTSRLRLSTSTFSHCTSLVPFAWLSPNVSTRVNSPAGALGYPGTAYPAGSSASRRGHRQRACGTRSPRRATRAESPGSHRVDRRFVPAFLDCVAVRGWSRFRPNQDQQKAPARRLAKWMTRGSSEAGWKLAG